MTEYQQDMIEQQILNNYLQDYNEILNHAKTLNYTDAEIDECFQNSIKLVQQEQYSQQSTSKLKKIPKTVKVLMPLTLVLITIYVLLNVHQPTSSLVLRNVQSFIYPGFKVIRNIGIPIISLFPTLTALYDETCLIENPFFQVSNLDCYPCEYVHSVINLTGLSLNHSIYESGTPFVLSDQRKHVFVKDLTKLYNEYSTVFNENAPWMITTNNSSFTNIGDVFNLLNLQNHDTDENCGFKKDDFVHWRINRMLPARYARKLFPRPGFISEWSGQSIERYILIDGPASQGYRLSSFECSYVFLIQGSGERDIILEATPECKTSCTKISVRMKPSHILWYNWWYWKPLSLPVENSTNVSVSYIGSHC